MYMSSPLEVIKAAEGTVFQEEDGDKTPLTLLPPLSADELARLEARLPCPLPQEARELLLYCRGFDGVLDVVDFAGDLSFEMDDVFPHCLPIAHDGYGNFWIVDLTAESTAFAPIFYACHDPPVIVFQTDTLAHFISEIIRFGNPPWKSEIDDVHEQFSNEIWSKNPKTMSHEQCLEAGDTDLVSFAESLDSTYLFSDLRAPAIGDGFSWGRFGRNTVCKRFEDKRIFAIQQRKLNWFQKIFGV